MSSPVSNQQVTIEWLRADTLLLPAYQRARMSSWAKAIARDFDPDRLDPLRVSRRKDGDYVIDGQHRLIAVRDMLGWHDQNVPCEVHHGLTFDQEIKIFAGQTSTGRKQIRKLDEWHARYLADSPEALALVAAIEASGLVVQWGGGKKWPNGFVAIGVAEMLMDSHGAPLLTDSLAVLHEAFIGDPRGWGSEFLYGVHSFLRKHGDHEFYSRPELVQRLKQSGVDLVRAKINRVLTGLGFTDKRVAAGRAMLELYNFRRTTRKLPDWSEGESSDVNLRIVVRSEEEVA